MLVIFVKLWSCADIAVQMEKQFAVKGMAACTLAALCEYDKLALVERFEADCNIL